MAEILSEQYSSIFSIPSTDLKKEDLEDFSIPEDQDLEEILQNISFSKQGVQEVLSDLISTPISERTVVRFEMGVQGVRHPPYTQTEDLRQRRTISKLPNG